SGVVDHLDQVIPVLVLKPLMPTAIQVEQHPGRRPTLAPLAMHPPLSPLLDQPRALQRQLHPGVAERDAVPLPQLLLKVPHVQVGVLLPIELQHLLGHLQRHTLRTGLAPPPVQQPVVPMLLVALLPPSHAAVRDPDNLRRLPPRDLLIARKITSWTFIARSQAIVEYSGILPPTFRMPQLPTASSGQITC